MKNVLFLLITVLLVVSVSQCGKKNSDTDENVSEKSNVVSEKLDLNQILRYNLSGNPETYDPALVTSTDEFNIAIQLFEGLLCFDPKDLSPQPGVAEKWSVSTDGLTYTFNLRSNAKWSDGVEITAQTFYDSWIRALSKSTNAEYAYMMHYIKNAKNFSEGKRTSKDVGIKVVDKYTLNVELETPVSYFPEIIVLPIYMPVPMHQINNLGNKWTTPQNIVCNGPFKVKSLEPKISLKLESNPVYWDSSSVKLKSIEISLLNDPVAHYEMYNRNELDWLNGLPKNKLDEILKTSNEEFFRVGSLGTEYYMLNLNVPVLKNVKVRRALLLSLIRVNLQDILKASIPSINFVPKNMTNYERYSIRENPELARKLLEEAGYPNGKNFPKLTILIHKNEERRLTAEKIKEMWKLELNIDVDIEEIDRNDQKKKLNAGDYQIGRTSWVGDYIDPSTFLEVFLKDSGLNLTGWSNSEYDKLLYQARVEQDPKKRSTLFLEAEKILIDEAPVVPLYNYVSMYMLKFKKVKGIHGNIMDIHPLKNVYIIQF